MYFNSVLQTVSINNEVSNESFNEYQAFCDAYWKAMKDPNIKLITVNPELD